MDFIVIRDWVGVLPGPAPTDLPKALVTLGEGKILNEDLYDVVSLQASGMRAVPFTTDLRDLIESGDQKPGDVVAAEVQILEAASGGGVFLPLDGSGTMTGTLDLGGQAISDASTIAVGTATPDPGAILELNSTSLAFLLPRLDTTQRDAITAVAGMVVFNTTTTQHETFSGSVWLGTGSGTSTLQQSYDLGNTVGASSARPVAFNNGADTTDLLTLTRTAGGAGEAMAVDMASGTTGDGVHVTVDVGSSSTALRIDQDGSGDALVIQGGDAVINAYTFPVQNVDTFTMPDTQGGGGAVLTDTLGNGVLAWVVPTGGGATLQTAYDMGAGTIATTAGKTIAYSNAVDTTDLLTLTRTAAGAGHALRVIHSTGTTDHAAHITVESGSTSTGLRIDQEGSGIALNVLGAGVSHLRLDGAGAFSLASAANQDISLLSNGSGDALFGASGTGDTRIRSGATAGDVDIDSVAGNVSLQVNSLTKLQITVAGAVDVTPTAAEDFTVTLGAGSAATIDGLGLQRLSLDASGEVFLDSAALQSLIMTAGSNAILTSTAGNANIDAAAGSVLLDAISVGVVALQIGSVTKLGLSVGGAVSVTPTNLQDFTVTTTGGAISRFNGPVEIVDAQAIDTLSIAKSGAVAGSGLSIAMATGTTGDALSIVSDLGSTGTALSVVQNGGGDALDVQGAGGSQIVLDATGAIDVDSATDTDINLQSNGTGVLRLRSAGTGNVSISALGGGNTNVASVSGALQFIQGGVNRLLITAASAVSITPASGQDFAVTLAGGGSAVINGGALDMATNAIADVGTIAVGTAAPATSAILELNSTTLAFLLPRMTTTQRDLLTAVAGMVIFNTTTAQHETFSGSVWIGTGSGTSTLQQSYNLGNAIAATAARSIAFSNAVDTTDLLTLTRTAAGAGDALSISMATGTTGRALSILSDAGSAGDAFAIDQEGSGDVADFRQAGNIRFLIDAAGAISATAALGQDITLGTSGAGEAALQALGSGPAVLSANSGDAFVISTTGDVFIDAAAGELNLEDVGGSGLTLSQVSDRVLTLTGGGEVQNGTTSLVAAINRLSEVAVPLVGFQGGEASTGGETFVVKTSITLPADATATYLIVGSMAISHSSTNMRSSIRIRNTTTAGNIAEPVITEMKDNNEVRRVGPGPIRMAGLVGTQVLELQYALQAGSPGGTLTTRDAMITATRVS